MTNDTPFPGAAFRAFPVIGILRGVAPALSCAAAAAAVDGGLTAVEVTMNSEDVLAQIEALRKALPGQVAVGAGTVTRVDDVRRVLNAGAEFIVSPVTDAAVMAAALEAGMPVFPGAMTPTEVLSARRAGAAMVKVFPAAPLGPDYIRALKGPLPEVPLLPTGGIGLHNIAAFLEAGADGFGIGSPLFRRERIMNRDWNWIQRQVEALKEAVQICREDSPGS